MSTVSIKCDICGKFRKKSELVGMHGEGSEQWIECRHCMSKSDEEVYFKEELNKEEK